MQVFKAFFRVLRKNLTTAVIFMTVFLVIAVAMSKNTKDTPLKLENEQIVSVFDEDDSPESRRFAELLDERFKVKEIANDRDVITDMLYYEDIEYALVINKGFGEKLANGETSELFSSYDMHRSYSAVVVEQFLEDYAGTVKAYTASGIPVEKAMDSARTDLLTETEVKFEVFTEEDPDFPTSFAAYFRYMPYILISAILSALCPVLMIMNRKEIRFRTNCSSFPQNSYNIQLFAGGAVFVIAVWAVFMIAGIFMYGGIFQGKAWLAVLNSLVFALISTALAVLIASLITTQNVLTLLVQAFGLGMSFLCGIFVPQSMLGGGVLAVGRFLPAYWYVRLNDMLCGNTIYSNEKALLCLGIETAFLAALLLVTILVRRLRYSGSQIMTAVKAG